MTTPLVDFHTTVTESVAELFGWCWPYSETDVVWNKAFIKDAIVNMLNNGCVQVVMRYQGQLFSIMADGKGGYTRLRINWSAYAKMIPAKEQKVKQTKPAAWNREPVEEEVGIVHVLDLCAHGTRHSRCFICNRIRGFVRVGDELVLASEYCPDDDYIRD